jgi:excisionase family DNA binding protein
MNRVNGMAEGQVVRTPDGPVQALPLPLKVGTLNKGTGNLGAGKSTECPVTAEEAAVFLKIARSTVMALARAGKIPAHPVTNGKRKRWLFFISELDAYVRGLGVNCGSHPCA